MKLLFPAISFSSAMMIACCIRSSKTRHAPAETLSHAGSASLRYRNEIASLASVSKVESYGNALICGKFGRNSSSNDHNAGSNGPSGVAAKVRVD